MSSMMTSMAASPIRRRRLLPVSSNPETPCKLELAPSLKRTLTRQDSAEDAKRMRTGIDGTGLVRVSEPRCDKEIPTVDVAQTDPASPAGAALQQSHDAATKMWPLPGRAKECSTLATFLSSRLASDENCEGALYISGGPGTGKTLCTRSAAQRHPSACYMEVNCFDLKQRSIDGLLAQLAKNCAARLSADGKSRVAAIASPLKSLVEALKLLNTPAVIVVDEVDQLVKRGPRERTSQAGPLEELVMLPKQTGLPRVAVVMIANAVDLLERSGLQNKMQNCGALLFEPYTADQLRDIFKARVQGAEVDRKSMELQVRRVAKHSGDCRQLLAVCEEAIQKKSTTEEGKVVQLDLKGSQSNPLDAINTLPEAQKVLLSALTGAKSGEAMRIMDVCTLYKDMCKKLRQSVQLASKGHVSNVLSLLEQRGLLSMRTQRGKGKGKLANEIVVELAVARDQVRRKLPQYLQQ